jgi:hypothetical protein
MRSGRESSTELIRYNIDRKIIVSSHRNVNMILLEHRTDQLAQASQHGLAHPRVDGIMGPNSD